MPRGQLLLHVLPGDGEAGPLTGQLQEQQRRYPRREGEDEIACGFPNDLANALFVDRFAVHRLFRYIFDCVPEMVTRPV